MSNHGIRRRLATLAGNIWQIVLTMQARLRFVAILVVVGAAIASWDRLQALYEKWVRPASAASAASSGDEFWCPMHPTVVVDHPDKCPICAMPLARRKKGSKDDSPLPAGTLSRVQLTPYRVALAGIDTVPVEYRQLTHNITAIGYVEVDETRLARITVRASGRHRIEHLHASVTGQWVEKGKPLVDLYSPDLAVTVQNLLIAQRSGDPDMLRLARERHELWGLEKEQIDRIIQDGKAITRITIRAPISGFVLKKYNLEGSYVSEGTPLYDIVDLSNVWIEAQVYEEDVATLRPGMTAKAVPHAFPERVFTGKLAFIHPHLDPGSRTLKVRFNVDNSDLQLRPGMVTRVTLQAPAAGQTLFQQALKEQWRQATAIGLTAHSLCSPIGITGWGGAEALFRQATQQTLLERGLVLAIPARSVIDTGAEQIVYREREPGLYEGVLTRLGPRSGDWYPVADGLLAGDRVASAGSFLIDAETRLSGGLSSTYFGASGGPEERERQSRTASENEDRDREQVIHASLGKLSAVDRPLALAQRLCPILRGSRLGSMGRPVKVVLRGQPVFLCCEGCITPARQNPDKTLATLARQKANRSEIPKGRQGKAR